MPKLCGRIVDASYGFVVPHSCAGVSLTVARALPCQRRAGVSLTQGMALLPQRCADDSEMVAMLYRAKAVQTYRDGS